MHGESLIAVITVVKGVVLVGRWAVVGWALPTSPFEKGGLACVRLRCANRTYGLNPPFSKGEVLHGEPLMRWINKPRYLVGHVAIAT